jgi:hypothetical protein
MSNAGPLSGGSCACSRVKARASAFRANQKRVAYFRSHASFEGRYKEMTENHDPYIDQDPPKRVPIAGGSPPNLINANRV